MPRRKEIDGGIPTIIRLKESIKGQVQLALFSEVEGTVPYGEMSALVNRLLAQWLTHGNLDLRPYGIEGTVVGDPHTLHQLQFLIQDLQRKEKEHGKS